jgi:hypothetical protein
MNKKAYQDGLSINVIIVAAIALIVLVVIVAIFTGRMQVFGLDVCKNNPTNAACDCDKYADNIYAEPLHDLDQIGSFIAANNITVGKNISETAAAYTDVYAFVYKQYSESQVCVAAHRKAK